jgi:hypothetical protein
MQFTVRTADGSHNYNGKYKIEDDGVLKIVPDDSQPKILSPAYWREIIEGEPPRPMIR